ncbi:DUF839 domain-containing protein [Mariprofundus erugo]|nr:DUF839 domain-containing protein [Mariprofundus erugo]
MQKSSWNICLTAGALTMISGCQLIHDDHSKDRGYSVAITASETPANDYQRGSIYSDSRMQISHDGKRIEFPLHYKPIFYTNDTIPAGKLAGQPFGALPGPDGEPLTDPTSETEQPYIADNPDGTTLIPLATVAKDGSAEFALITHFEYVSRNEAGSKQYLLHPMFVGNGTLTQADNGSLNLTNYSKQPMKMMKGLWSPCAASVSPWGTHLGSEEYEPDAFHWSLGYNGKAPGVASSPKMERFVPESGSGPEAPYHYGYLPEFKLDTHGMTEGVKHYSLGRFSHEATAIMPDGRTAYAGDDVRYGALFMSIADRANDLSANTLYAARWEQQNNQPTATAKLSWIRLGHASDAEIEALIKSGIGFTDIFAVSDHAADGFHAVADRKGNMQFLRLQSGMEQAAAFLESRRYAAYLGASVEFSHLEGIVLDAEKRQLFLAASSHRYGMSDNQGDIRIAEHESGGVFAISLGTSGLDQHGDAVPTEWLADGIQSIPELTGRDLRHHGQWQADANGNLADPERIANPDNLAFSAATRLLILGEDSELHINNFVWAWNVDTRQLGRILSLPMGAEAAGLQVLDNLNGYMYIITNYQHPGAPNMAVTPAVLEPVKRANPEFAAGIEKRSAVGVIAIETGKRHQLPWMKSEK